MRSSCTTNKHTRDNLNIIRSVRNVFAHTKRIIDFNDEAIVLALKGTALPTQKYSRRAKAIREVRRFKYGSQTAFIHLCFAVDIELLRRKTRGNAASGRNLRRLKSRFFGNLATFGKASGFKGLGFFDYVYPNGKPD